MEGRRSEERGDHRRVDGGRWMESVRVVGREGRREEDPSGRRKMKTPSVPLQGEKTKM